MKKIILSIFTCILFTIGFAQETDTTKKTIDLREFSLVEVEAQFPGGTQGWVKYLTSNLKSELGNKYIKLKKGQKLARQTVKVQFVVSKEGAISNLVVLNPDEVHPKLAAEAIRVISKGPNWTPAKQNGKNVTYMARQSITFQVTED